MNIDPLAHNPGGRFTPPNLIPAACAMAARCMVWLVETRLWRAVRHSRCEGCGTGVVCPAVGSRL